MFQVQSKSKTSQSVFRSNLSKFGQINESEEYLTGSSTIDYETETNDVTFLDTQKAWTLLKTNGINDSQPEYYKFTGSKLQNYYDDTESVKSLPKHNIPYTTNDFVCSLASKF